jgi:hypothetical protein
MDKLHKHLRFIESYELTTLITVAIILAFSLYYLCKANSRLAVAAIDLAEIDTSDVTDLKLLFEDEDYFDLLDSLYNFAVDTAPGLIQSGTISSSSEKLTIYSLFKQAEIGDADSQEGLTEDAKFYAWNKQKGKKVV